MYYGNKENHTSLDDQYSDLAIFDSMFPGIMVPNRVWGSFKNLIMQKVSNLNCSLYQTIHGQQFNYCFQNSTCNRTGLEDIYLFFNATTRASGNFTQYMLAYNKENFALEATLPTYNEEGQPTEINICRLQIYG